MKKPKLYFPAQTCSVPNFKYFSASHEKPTLIRLFPTRPLSLFRTHSLIHSTKPHSLILSDPNHLKKKKPKNPKILKPETRASPQSRLHRSRSPSALSLIGLFLGARSPGFASRRRRR